MTPKEQAISLYNRFLPYIDARFEILSAKKCALIAVYEILESQPSRRYWDTYDDETPSASIYWQEVKEEIIRL